jgi:hypothetical protein
MKSSALVCTAIGALALGGIATTMPAQARDFGPALAGGLIAGALVAGALSSAYAYAPGPAYAYDGYGWGPGYYGYYGGRGPYHTYGSFDESQHGGTPSYSRPLGR